MNARIKPIVSCLKLFTPFILLYLTPLLHAEPSLPTSNQHPPKSYGRLPLTFEANRGQVDDQVKFLSRGQGYSLFLTENEAILSLNRSGTHKTDVVRLQLVGANPNPIVEGIEIQTNVSNYLIGNDPSQWRTAVPHMSKVIYRQVYDDIDLVYYDNQDHLEYDYIIAPGADPKVIRMRFIGAKKAYLDKVGNLILQTTSGEVIQQAPVSYQEIDGQRQKVESRYILHDHTTHIEVGFDIGMYNTNTALIIDPILDYATYLKGNDHDRGQDITVDQSGNVYVIGYTYSSNFPVQNALQGSYGGAQDAFIAKSDATGTLEYVTYFGGSGGDIGFGIESDQAGDIYITGQSASSDFPVKNALQNSPNGSFDVFIAKLNAAGNTLIFSTFLGGSDLDRGNDIALDQTGSIYITGDTKSTDFPLQNALQSSHGGGDWDTFVAKFNATATVLTYATFLGGTGTDFGHGIGVDQVGNAYITGSTSGDFPLQNALQNSYGGGDWDAFVAKLNATATALTYATFLGGTRWDIGNGIAVDQEGNAYITGMTESSNFPLQNAFQSSLNGNTDAFITKLDTAGSEIFSTYFGGNSGEIGHDIVVDQVGNTYVTGMTVSSNFPLQNAFQSSYGGAQDAFIIKLNPVGSAPIYATYFGGSSTEIGYGIAVDQAGNAYITGSSYTNPPTNALLTAKISPLFLSTTDLTFGNAEVGLASQQTLTLSNNGLETLNVTEITISGTNSSTFSASPSSFSLAVGQSQTITITFAPISSGAHSASLSIVNDISTTPLSVPLSGQGTVPVLSLSTSSTAFGNVSVGSSSQQIITLSNTGDATLNVTGITLSGTDDNLFSVSPISFAVSSGQNQTVTITFSPTASGNKSASLSIAHNASGSPTSATLSGQGIAPVISLSTAAVEFGNISVNSSSQQTVTVSNTGDDTLSVIGITPSGSDAGMFSASPTAFTVLPSQTQDVTVTFLPTSSGSKFASLSITHNASGSPSTASLTGQGLAPIVSLSTSSIDFGNVSANSSTQQTLTVSNTGDDTLSVTGITLSGTDASLFSVSPTNFTISPSQNRTITLTFSPISSDTKSASLSITHNASGSPSAVSLTGQGIVPIILLSSTSITFGNIPVGNSSIQTVTVSNTGDDTLRVTSIASSNASNFSVTTTAFTTPPSQNQTITITATPNTFGTFSGNLSISHNASGSPSTISLTATGTAPDISLSANALNFGDVQTNTDKTLTLVVSNAGNVDLSISNITSSNSFFTVSPSSFTISVNNNQGVGITFEPASTGDHSATLTIASNDPDQATLTITLTGNGTAPPPPPPPPPPPQTPAFSPSTQTISFGDVRTGQQQSQSLTISNTGNATLTVSNIAVTGTAFAISETNFDVSPGQNQGITITFTPSGDGQETGSLSIDHNASGSPAAITLTGTGIMQPDIHNTITNLDFAQVLVGATQTFNVWISNPGNADLQITSLAFTNPRFESATPSLTISGGDSQAVGITFRPAVAGLNTGTLTILHNAQADPIEISLSGEGVMPPSTLQITPDTLDFARVDINDQLTKSLRLENPTSDTVNIISFHISRLEFQTVQDLPIPIVLAPNASHIFDLLFSPRRSGTTSGTLSLTTQDTALTVPLQGEGVVAQPALTPLLELTPSEIIFEHLSETQPDTALLTLSNAQGTGVLFVDAIHSDDPLVNALADSFWVKPAEQHSIQIIAQPTQRAFPTGQIQITSSDPNQPSATITWRAGILLQDLVLIDLDPQIGNQNLSRKSGIGPGDSITVQFFSKDFPPVTGYGMFADYDTQKLTYLAHNLSTDFISGATDQVRASSGRVDVGLVSFTSTEASGSAFLGDLSFVLTDAFTDSTSLSINTITLSLPSGGLQELPQSTQIWLIKGISPDFTGDGTVDFRDFLLFGQAFGSSNPNFDLDGDGSVDFPDFIIFATAFGSDTE